MFYKKVLDKSFCYEKYDICFFSNTVVSLLLDKNQFTRTHVFCNNNVSYFSVFKYILVHFSYSMFLSTSIYNLVLIYVCHRGYHFGQKVYLGGKNTFYSQSVLHHFLSISEFLDFSNLILNGYFEVNFVTCQDG